MSRIIEIVIDLLASASYKTTFIVLSIVIVLILVLKYMV